MRFTTLLIATSILAAAHNCTPAAAAGEPPATKPAKSPTGGREVDLRPKFQTGRETRFQFELTSSNQLKSDAVPDLDGDQTLTQSIGLRLHTVEASDDGATVELVYDRIRATFETKDFKASFDSSSTPASTTPATVTPPAKPTGTRPANPPSRTTSPSKSGGPAGKSATDREMDDLLAQIMRPMVGTKLTLKVDPSGNIKSVSGGEALGGNGLAGLEGLLGGLGGGGGLTAGGLGGLTPSVGGADAGPMNCIITGPGQRGTVRVGESWTNNDTLTGTPVGGIAMVTKHTCRSASGDTAQCAFTGHADAASSGAGGASPLGGFQLKESSYDGTYAWDTARGELSELTSNLNTRIDQGGGKDKEGATRLSAKTKVTVRRVK